MSHAQSPSDTSDLSDEARTPVQHPLDTDDDDDISFELANYSTEDTATEDEEIVEFIDAEQGDNPTRLTPGELLALLAGDGDDNDGEEEEDDEDINEDEDGDGNEIELNLQGPSTAESASEADREAEAPAEDDNARTHIMRITRNHLIRFMRARGGNGLWNGSLQALLGADDEDDDDDDYNPYGRTRRRRPPASSEFPKVPSDQGRELMESGIFGTNERSEETYSRKRKLSTYLMKRELSLGSPGREHSINKLAAQGMLPSWRADTIINYDQRCYSGQFSDDGNFFFSCSKDFRVRMYDTSNPYDWKYYKTVIYPFGHWTITDASLSPDNRFLAYSSINSMVCLAATDPSESSDPHFLDFAQRSVGRFGIWSVRFSGDGRELVAGTSVNSVCAFDIETRQTVLHIQGHDDEVNAVCFGDKSSPHLLYSGSDDATIKVWDRRSMSDKRAAGVFLGHTEGLTYIDSKGDGRYVLSNGKDQTMKLWDLRKMMSTEKAETIDSMRYSLQFDYRFDNYDTTKYYQHPYDCSLVTYRGHSVLKTLIRCHFSPPGSTDSRYVYSASEDGKVYIYNMDATLAGKVDVMKATHDSRRHGSDGLGYIDERGRSSWKTCVRDASWHPTAPLIAATSWSGYTTDEGTCTVHSWNDGMDDDEAEPRMGRTVNARLGDEPAMDADHGPRFGRRARMRAMAADDD